MQRKRLKRNKQRTMNRRTQGNKTPRSSEDKLEAKVKREAVIERAKK